MFDIEEREKITQLFEKYKLFLPQSQFQILHLYLNEDLSIGEISKLLAMTRSAVFDAFKKGKKKLVEISQKLEV